MRDFKTIILQNLHSIEWMYERNENGEYDPRAIYRGSTREIEHVFHFAFADSLIEYRNERMTTWNNWITEGTLTTPAGVSSPFIGTSTCTNITNPMDSNLAYTMRDAFRMIDPNMKFSHLNVFKAINEWFASTMLTIFLDGSLNLTTNPIPFFPNTYMLLTNANIMEGEIFLESQEEGFGMENYWEIFGKYLDLSISSSIQLPVMMSGMYNGNMFNGTCHPKL